MGVTRILDYVSLLKKPVVVHNGMLDLMFLYDKFFEPLPETVSEYTTRLHSLLPHIYDTKHLINTRMQLKADFSTDSAMGLSEIYARCMQPDYLFG